MLKNLGRTVLIVSVLLGAEACSSLSSGGPVPEESFVENRGAADQGIRLFVTQDAGGKGHFRLLCSDLGSITVQGNLSSDVDGMTLEFSTLEWFSTWSNGWTEASFLLEGTMTLRCDPTSDIWVLSLKSQPKLDAVRSAAVRYFDTYIRGEVGTQQFTLRWQRIQAVCRELTIRSNGPGLARQPEILARYLFPEVYDPSRVLPPSKVSFHAGLEWNREYTKTCLPEGLQKLRDDGTLLRDFQETPELWQLALVWDDFWLHRGNAAGLWQGATTYRSGDSL